MLLICDVGVSSQLGLHQQCVYDESDYEGPYVVDGVDEVPERTAYVEVCHKREDECQHPCDDCSPVYTVGVPVSAFLTLEQGHHVDALMLAQEVVCTENCCDRCQNGTVSVHPCHVSTAGAVDPPCLQYEKRKQYCYDNTSFIGNLLRRNVGESVCRSNNVSTYTCGVRVVATKSKIAESLYLQGFQRFYQKIKKVKKQ